jgi:hypothetical protein
LLHLGLEVDIDRESNKYINMSIFRFDIEDTQKDVHIALPFRVTPISPNFLIFIVDFYFSIYLA